MAVGDRSNIIPRNQPIGAPSFPLRCEAITPSDTVTYPDPVAIEVWSAGNIVVSPYGGGGDITLTVTAGMASAGPFMVKFMVKAVKATGTTATTIFGIW